MWPTNFGRTTTMPTSGIIATKEDVLPFADSCVVLRWQWRNFEILFRGTDLKRELLGTTVLEFFRDVNTLYIEHLVLHICRLTDDASNGGPQKSSQKYLKF
jgi:hypothetical protein